MFAKLCSASHFIYGTMNWEPTSVTKVQFTLETAYKLDYDWSSQVEQSWTVLQTVDGVDTELNVTTLASITDLASGSYYLKMPTGTGGAGEPLVNGRMCANAYDTGDSPGCDGYPVGTLLNNRKDPNTNLYIPYDNGGDIVEGNTAVPCESPDDTQADYCSPWFDTYGFFFGDGYTHDVVFSVSHVDATDSTTGNYVKAVATFEHTYPSNKKSVDEPYIAFFTGGNKLDSLNNNKAGRFRLETSVNIQGDNRSPVASFVPILPVPYTGRSVMSAYGYMATFKFVAYDPDISSTGFGTEEVTYKLASSIKQGALLANSIPEGSYPALWLKEEYTAKRASGLSVACVGSGGQDCDYCLPGSGKQYLGASFDCEQYPGWDNSVNLAHNPPALTLNETTGVVQWETGVNPFVVDGEAYKEDFDADGNGVVGNDGDGIAGEVPSPLKSPLSPGFYNLVLDIRSSSHDPCIDTGTCSYDDYAGHISIPLDFLLYLYPPMRMCHGDCLNSGSQSSAINGRQGVSTFQDPDGYYGHFDTTSPPEQWTYDSPGTGVCTLCGGGVSSEAAVYNPDICEPASGDSCAQYEIEGTLEVDHACKSGVNDCCPGVHVPVSSPVPSTTVRNDYENFLPDSTGAALSLGYNRSCDRVEAVPPVSSLPYSRIIPAFGSCYVNTAPVIVDDDSCNPDKQNTLPVDPDIELSSGPRARLVLTRGSDVAFEVVAKDDDPCTELSIQDTGLYDTMVLSGHTRDSPTQVRRKFYWNATSDAAANPAMDARPTNSMVCFYPFDNYLAGAMRCINIVLPTCFQFESTKLLSSESSQQLISFRLFDCAGYKIRHLGCDAFIVKENSVVVDSLETSLQCLEPYQAYLLLLDLSASIGNNSAMLAFVKQSIRNFVTSMFEKQCYNSQLMFSIRGFAGDQETVEIMAFMGDEDLILQNIDQLDSSVISLFDDYRPTNLHGAVIHALEILDNDTVQWSASTQYVSSNLVLFTDGEDTTGYKPLVDAVVAVNASDHEVFVMGINNGDSLSQATVDGLGAKSGFKYLVQTEEEMTSAFDSVIEYVKDKFSNTYSIAYCSPRRSGNHTLEITTSGQSTGNTISFDFDASKFVTGASCQATPPPPTAPVPSTPTPEVSPTTPEATPSEPATPASPAVPSTPAVPTTPATPTPTTPEPSPAPPAVSVVEDIYDDDSSSSLVPLLKREVTATRSKAAVTNLTLLSTEDELLELYTQFVETATEASSRRKLVTLKEVLDLLELVFSFEMGVQVSAMKMAYIEFVASNKMKVSLGWDPKAPVELASTVLALENAITSQSVSRTLLEYEISIMPQFSSEDQVVINEYYRKANNASIDEGISQLSIADLGMLLDLMSSPTNKDLQDSIKSATIVNSLAAASSSASGGSSSSSLDKEDWFYIIIAIAGGVFCICICGVCVCFAVQKGQVDLMKDLKEQMRVVQKNNYVGMNGNGDITHEFKSNENNHIVTIENSGKDLGHDSQVMTKEESEEDKEDSPYVSESEIINDDETAELEMLEMQRQGLNWNHPGYANEDNNTAGKREFYENQRRM